MGYYVAHISPRCTFDLPEASKRLDMPNTKDSTNESLESAQSKGS